jgi:hypothetical protein
MLYIHLNFYNSILTVTFYELVFNIRIDNYHTEEAVHVTRHNEISVKSYAKNRRKRQFNTETAAQVYAMTKKK